ncbi:calcium and integrin-binding protein 1-like [Xylocopa sonorina]|uniref:calcium and integrin-binding protein 1-like n=1 Tax=Xylocopa sonorina TaxID=1818115 RepID=UPI00403ACBC2
MGIGKSQFSEEELQDYQDLTYFTKKEILHAHQKFKALAPEKVGHNRNAKLPMSKILQYPELRANPFGDRICKVFSSSQDGDCTFEDFLDMMSVFSDAAPKAVKAEHAFRIFDFDGDDMLGIGDLRQVVDRLTASQRLNETDIQQVLQYILDEADLDDDGALSFAEFEHIIEKSSDFSKSFSIHLRLSIVLCINAVDEPKKKKSALRFRILIEKYSNVSVKCREEMSRRRGHLRF